MESSLKEIWDEIEMRFGHWVIGAGIQSINGIKQFGNWSLRIAHCQMVIGNWSLAISHLREFLKVLKNVEELKCVWEYFIVCESVWDENLWEYLRWACLRVFMSVLNENVWDSSKIFECSGMFHNVLECSRMF